ncbi:TPA: hypothetical protein QCK11_005134 [Enterobacter asburiae]|nr:hypothetical protein [Enterobacter asburiae]HDR2865078.1 hypothetical protein [Enterobacter asburiae]
MSVEAFSFFIGAALLLAGILGGGVKIKEIEFPTLSKLQRIVAVVLSIVFIALGLLFRLGILPFKVHPINNVHYTIQDTLGENQRGDEINLEIDGDTVGTLHVDETNMKDSIDLEATPGKHRYSLSGVGMYKIDGEYITIPINGEGFFTVTDGTIFSLDLISKSRESAVVNVVRIVEFHGNSGPSQDSFTVAYKPISWDTVAFNTIELSYSVTVTNSNEKSLYCSISPEIILKRDDVKYASLSKDERIIEITSNGKKLITGKLRAEKRADPDKNIIETSTIAAWCSFKKPDNVE